MSLTYVMQLLGDIVG